MVRYFPRFGRTEFNWRLTPFHLLSAKRTTRKKLAQLKNTSKEQQRNPVIFFFFPWCGSIWKKPCIQDLGYAEVNYFTQL